MPAGTRGPCSCRHCILNSYTCVSRPLPGSRHFMPPQTPQDASAVLTSYGGVTKVRGWRQTVTRDRLSPSIWLWGPSSPPQPCPRKGGPGQRPTEGAGSGVALQFQQPASSSDQDGGFGELAGCASHSHSSSVNARSLMPPAHPAAAGEHSLASSPAPGRYKVR